ncbi:MAG: ParB/RepB/Spo0J family partition protein, partial [Burkholderiales bacterium]
MMTLDTLKGLDVASLMRDATGRPLALPVDKIEPDPDNIRTKIDPAALKALAETIQSEGLIQPISVRPHPKKKGHYLINAGERRWRAVKLLGRETIDAYVREPFDPYVQAIENLQREDLSALDLAQWVAKREADGESRATIARKLGKPASFITEAATLARAPTPIVAAFDSGQIPDTRTAYLLANAWDTHGATVRALLASDAPLTRAGVVSALAAPASP